MPSALRTSVACAPRHEPLGPGLLLVTMVLPPPPTTTTTNTAPTTTAYSKLQVLPGPELLHRLVCFYPPLLISSSDAASVLRRLLARAGIV
jgi:hypothetical protein